VFILARPEVFYPNDVWVSCIFAYKIKDARRVILKWPTCGQQNFNNFLPFARLGNELVDERVVAIHNNMIALDVRF